MPYTNFRNPYGFEPQDYDYQNAGGLPGLLRALIANEPEQGKGPGWKSNANSIPETYGNPQGLLGRLLALQTGVRLPTDESMKPISYGARQSDSGDAQVDSSVDASSRYQASPQQEGTDDGQLDAHDADGPQSVESAGSNADWPTQGTDPRREDFVMPPLPIFPAPTGGFESPPSTIPAPHVPEWWDLAKRIFNVFPMASSGAGDDPDRPDPIIETFRRCMRAAERNKLAWVDFCDDLPPDALQLRAVCKSNTGKLPPERKGFCYAHFTPD